MEARKLTCRSCRNECVLEVLLEEKEIIEVKGNGCRRGLVSARKLLEKEAGKEKGGNAV